METFLAIVIVPPVKRAWHFSGTVMYLSIVIPLAGISIVSGLAFVAEPFAAIALSLACKSSAVFITPSPFCEF